MRYLLSYFLCLERHQFGLTRYETGPNVQSTVDDFKFWRARYVILTRVTGNMIAVKNTGEECKLVRCDRKR